MSRRISTIAAALVATLTLQQAGCLAQSDVDREYERELRKASLQLDDEELFRELMFPNARAAEAVPELGRIYDFIGYEQLDKEQLAAMKTVQEIVVHNIHQLDPDFIQYFAERVTSGDVLEVDAAMTDAHVMIRKSLGMLGGSFQLILQEDNVDVLRKKLTEGIGKDGAEMLTQLKTLDPKVLEAMVQIVGGHLADVGLPHDDTQIATSIDSQLNLSTQLQSFMQLSTQLQSISDVQLQNASSLALQTSTDLSKQTSASIDAATASTKQLQLQTSADLQQQSALMIESSIDKQLSIDNQSASSLSIDTSAGNYAVAVLAVAVAAVAVAVVVVAVFEVAHPIDGMNVVHGDSKDLFREQMIANITKAYAV